MVPLNFRTQLLLFTRAACTRSNLDKFLFVKACRITVGQQLEVELSSVLLTHLYPERLCYRWNGV